MVNTYSTTTFAETYLPTEWAQATGRPCSRKPEIQRDVLDFPSSEHSEERLLPPTSHAAALYGSELAHMQGVLASEKILEDPAGILGKKFSRIRLPNGQVAEFMRTASQEGARRRDCVVRFRSTSRKRVRGAEEVSPVYFYGAVHHYIVVYVARKPMAFAY